MRSLLSDRAAARLPLSAGTRAPSARVPTVPCQSELPEEICSFSSSPSVVPLALPPDSDL